MKVSYLGTTMLLFDDGVDQVLFDAHLTRPSKLQFAFGKLTTDRETVDAVLADFPMDRLRAIFISHTHFDHVMDAAYIAGKTGAVLYGSESAGNVGRGGGLDETQLRRFDPAESYGVGGFTIRVIPSIHSKPNLFNNDLGQVIGNPLPQPARGKDYKEGGSFDFYITHGEQSFLIRPSYNFIPHQLDGIRADVLFLGIAGLGKAGEAEQRAFFAETVEKTGAKIVIPLHWDNFMKSFRKPAEVMSSFMEDSNRSMGILAEYCAKTDRQLIVQWPLSHIVLS